MLEQRIRRYQNRAIEAAQMIEELIPPREGGCVRPTSNSKKQKSDCLK